MVTIVVGDRTLHVHGIDERKMKLPPVYYASVGPSLDGAVKKVRHYLVGDKKTQKPRASLSRNCPEERGPLGIGALVLKRRQGVVANRGIGNLRRARTPSLDLA
jgi:hypothetical protein